MKSFVSRLTTLTVATVIICVPLNASAQQTRSPSIMEFFGFKASGTKQIGKNEATPAKKIKKKSTTKVTGRKKPKLIIAPTDTTGQDPAVQVLSQPTDLNAVLEKMPDAKTVLVVGDFMAGGVAEGLDSAFTSEAGIKVVEKSNGSSGFIRDDYYNWSGAIPAIIAETNPTAIAIMIGTNDRQPLRLNNKNEPVRSPAWTSEYERRVSEFATTLKATGLPIVWIGLPPFQSSQMTIDYLAFNDIYRKAAQNSGGSFVDIWEGFVNDQGTFTVNGFDYTGQPARLRSNDGINLATAGKRKIAFFAEKAIRAALGDITQQKTIYPLGPFALPGPVRPAAPNVAAITRLAPISLFDPAFDGDTELLGGPVVAPIMHGTLPARELYAEGKLPDAKPGRVDDFKVTK